MEIEDENIRDRLLKASHMGQEPKDRLWSVIIVLAVVTFALGGFLLETRLFLSEGRALSYERAAVDCLELIVDNDRNFDLPRLCYDHRVVVHFPPAVCEAHFEDSTCSSKWEDQ